MSILRRWRTVQFVHKPDRFSQDAIIPGRVTDARGFVSTGVVIEGLQGPVPIYLSAEGIRLAASRYTQLGLVDSDVHKAVALELEDAQAAVERLTAENAELTAKLDRISGLKRDGFQVSRIQGRPRKEVSA
jgi:hypothetical protein